MSYLSSTKPRLFKLKMTPITLDSNNFDIYVVNILIKCQILNSNPCQVSLNGNQKLLTESGYYKHYSYVCNLWLFLLSKS